MAENLLTAYGLEEFGKPEYLIAQSEAFQQWIATYITPTDRLLHYPIQYFDGRQCYRSQINQLLHTDTNAISITECHLPVKQWDKKLLQQLPECKYQHWALQQLLPEMRILSWVHLPLQGVVLRVDS